MSQFPKIAIIGAGLTGLCLARDLRDLASVTVFEKSRGLGGRMSTRRTENYQFDHGAQFFSARGAAFQAFLDPHLAQGTVAPWAPRRVRLLDDAEAPQWTAPRYVAVPGMTALAKALAQDIDIRQPVQIDQMAQNAGGWQLTCVEGRPLGSFDWVISTAPALQTARLMPDDFAGRAALDGARMQGCYSLMLGFQTTPDLDWDAAWVGQDPLAWIAVNTSKPGRSGACSVVAQTSNDWADAHLEHDQTDVRRALMTAFTQATGQDAAVADYVSLHRWRYASVAVPVETPFLIDPRKRLAAAGDWCGPGKVEAAFDSASALADALRQVMA